MSGPDRERWRAVSPYLDRALDLAGEERAAWLASLRSEDPALAADIETLLERRGALEREGFLEGAPAAPPAQASLAGQVLGPYTLRSLLGQGGMGSVWLAERSDGRFQGVAAVKLLNASLVGRDGEARFRREGSILARLRHPHIAHLIDAGLSSSGQPYLILERVDGERIDRYCDARSLSIDARIRLFLDVLAAVAHAHANLIVHRDIKPSNVLVGTDGQVKLLDFGIAKLIEGEAGSPAVTALTRDGESALTPEYAAPEQLTGGHVTTATDVYALGVLLYVLLTGQHPAGKKTGSPADLIRAIVDTEPLRVSDAVTSSVATSETALETAARRATSVNRLRGQLKGDLDNIVARALKKSSAERYPSVEALAEDLRRSLAHEPVSARADSLAYRTARFVRRNRAAVALALLAVAALVAGLVGTVSQARRARAQAALAETQRLRADQERDFALRQLSRAEAINDLNTFVLSDAAPLGKPFTSGELLARAERIVDRQQNGADENRADLLVSIGRQYQTQDEHGRARQVLAKAYELARKSPDHATRSTAACALAGAVATAGEGKRAEELLKEGLAELPSEPQFALHRINCLLRGSSIARQRGDARTSVERAEAAQRLTRESRFASPLLGLTVLMDRAEAYRLAGRFREAGALFEEAFGQLASLGRDDTEKAGTLLNNWGLTLRSAGHILEAERLLRRAIQIGSANGTEDSVSPMLLNNMARALADLDRLAEAADYAERAYTKARRSGNEVVIILSLLARATIYRQRGDLPRAAAMLSELEPRAQRMWKPGHPGFAMLASEWAELAQARGDLSAALSGADRAIALAGTATQQPEILAKLLLRRSELRLRVNSHDLAAADAEVALRLARQSAPPETFSSTVGLAQLALGRALQAQGKPGEAAAAFTAGVGNLEPSLGAEHPATRSARRLAASSAPNSGR